MRRYGGTGAGRPRLGAPAPACSLAAALLLAVAACAPRAADGPDVPPPYPAGAWIATAPGAHVERDGLALRVVTGAEPAVAFEAGSAAVPPPWEVRTQLWLEARTDATGDDDAPFGVAIGLDERAGEGCLVLLDPAPRVRLARWSGGEVTPLGGWQAVEGAEPDADTPDADTGAYAIRDVSVAFAAGTARATLSVRVDGRSVAVEGDVRECAGGRAGVYAAAGAAVRVAYLSVTPAAR